MFNLFFLVYLKAKRWGKPSCYHPCYQVKISKIVDMFTEPMWLPEIVVDHASQSEKLCTFLVYLKSI